MDRPDPCAPREISRADSLETLAAGLRSIEESTLIVQEALRKQRRVPERASFFQQLRGALQHPAAVLRIGGAALLGAGVVAVLTAVYGPEPAVLKPVIAAVEIPVPVATPPPAELEPVIVIDDEEEPAVSARDRAREAARTLTRRASQARASGKHGQATRLYRQALDALPTYGPASEQLALMYLDRGDYRTALRYAKQALRGAPRKIPYMILVGDLHHLLKEDKAARKHWELAAHYGSARAQRRLDKLDPDS